MGNGRIEQTTWQSDENHLTSFPVSPDLSEEVQSNRHLRYASKLFPRNAFVLVAGRQGIFRVVSEPYIPPGYSYPHFDVEALGERFCASVFTATRISISRQPSG